MCSPELCGWGCRYSRTRVTGTACTRIYSPLQTPLARVRLRVAMRTAEGARRRAQGAAGPWAERTSRNRKQGPRAGEGLERCRRKTHGQRPAPGHLSRSPASVAPRCYGFTLYNRCQEVLGHPTFHRQLSLLARRRGQSPWRLCPGDRLPLTGKGYDVTVNTDDVMPPTASSAYALHNKSTDNSSGYLPPAVGTS